MFTKGTKERLDELEAQREQLETDIIKQEIVDETVTREQVVLWLKEMKKLDLSLDDSKRKLIDTFVNSIVLYDDKVVVSFNCKERASEIALSKYSVSDSTISGAPRICVVCRLFASGADFFFVRHSQQKP